MIKKDLFSLDIDALRIKYSLQDVENGKASYCYICENAHVGCKFHCERYGKKIEADEEISEINISFVEICKAKLAELKGGAE